MFDNGFTILLRRFISARPNLIIHAVSVNSTFPYNICAKFAQTTQTSQVVSCSPHTRSSLRRAETALNRELSQSITTRVRGARCRRDG